MIIKLLRYLEGYVQFIILGKWPENFINICSKTGLYIWGIKPTSKGYEGYTSVASYKQFPKISRQSKTRTKIVARKGIPFILTKHKKRWGIWVGLIVALGMLYILSSMIWVVGVNGTVEIDAQTLKDQLQTLGLKPGALRKNIDAPKLEKLIMLTEKRIAWVAINVQGSRVMIEVRERVAPPEPIDVIGYASNVVANDTGQIKQMDVYDGQLLVKIGDTVCRGDIIVSGITLDKFGNTLLKQARASVLAWVPKKLDVSIPMSTQKVTKAGDEILYKYIAVGDLKIPLVGARNLYTDFVTSHTNQDVFGLDWLSYQTTTITPIKTETIAINEFEAKEQAMLRLTEKEQNIFASNPIIDRQLYAVLEGENFVLRGDYIIEKDIAMSVEILLD